MATLNIKGFPDDLYGELRKAAEREHRSISQQVTHMLSRALEESARKRVRLTDLRGLGREIWKDVDTGDYVARERDSWET